MFAILPAGSAHGQATTAEAISGRIFWASSSYRGFTRFTRLVVWNAKPGGVVEVGCAGRRINCAALADTRVPRSGFIDFTRRVRRWRFQASDELLVHIWNECATCYPDANKFFRVTARRRVVPQVERYCNYYADRFPDKFDCAAPCPPPPHLQFLDYCQGAGELLPPARFSVTARPASGGGVRITDFRIDDLPQQPPFTDPVIAVFCSGRGCPIGGAARFLAGSQAVGGSLDLRSLARRPLRPGAAVEVVVLKGNFIGSVQRYTVTGRELVASSLCLYPTEVTPRPCPPPPDVPPPPTSTGG